MIESGFEHLHGMPFNMTTITSGGYERFYAAAQDIIDNVPFRTFYNRFAGYPLSRELTEESEKYRALYVAMERA